MSSALKPAHDNSPERSSIWELMQLSVNLNPFPHVISSEFIAPNAYQELCRSFPQCPPSTGPTGFSLFWGDEGYARLLEEQPAWRGLFDTFHSQRFIEWGRQQFAMVWERAGCKINLSGVRYVPYREDRIDKERATLRKVEHEPHELWVRMDIHQGKVGYDRVVHVDHARRLIISWLRFRARPGLFTRFPKSLQWPRRGTMFRCIFPVRRTSGPEKQLRRTGDSD